EHASKSDPAAADPYQIAQAVGGSILFCAMILTLIIFIYLAFLAPKGEEIYPIAELRDDSIATPKIFENWALWTGITIALILFAYTIPLIDIIQSAPPGSPGFK